MNRKPSKCRFAILFIGRTGSSHVVSCLNSHPDILCYGEILKANKPQNQDLLFDCIERGEALENFSHWALPDRYIHDSTLAPRKLACVGFKSKISDVADLSRFRDQLHEGNYRIIYLDRQNLVKRALSGINSRRLHAEHNIYNAVNTSQVQGPVEIDPRELLLKIENALASKAQIDTFIGNLKLAKLVLTYEQLLANESAFFRQLFQFLEVADAPVTGNIYKNTPDDLRLALINYDEVARALAGSPYAHFLHGP